MSATLTAARAVLGSRDRATSILTVLAFALPHAILLSVTGGVLMFFSRTHDLPDGFEGMGGFYVILACFAGLLMIVPTLSMGAAAARLGMSRRARDLAVLRLMGLGPAQTRCACLIETAVYAAIGVVCGTALYGALLPVWQLISFQGQRIGVHEMWVGPLVLLAEAVLMIVLAAVSSMLAMRKVVITPLGVTRRTEGAKVSPLWLILMLVLVIVWVIVAQMMMQLGMAIAMGLFFGFLGVIFALVNVVGAFSVSLLGNAMASLARTPQMLLAGRRIADDPKSVWRSFGAVALVAFIVGVLMPIFSSMTMGDTEEVARILMSDIRTGMLLTFGITMALGAISTAINQAIRVIDSVDQMKALEFMGSPRNFMDRSRRIEILLPALLMIGGAMSLGILFMSPVMLLSAGLAPMLILVGMTVLGIGLIMLASEATGPLRRKLLSDLHEGNNSINTVRNGRFKVAS